MAAGLSAATRQNPRPTSAVPGRHNTGKKAGQALSCAAIGAASAAAGAGGQVGNGARSAHWLITVLTGSLGRRDGFALFPGELHPPADHFGGMQPDDRPGRLAVRGGRIRESFRPAADQHASGPPRWQHVIHDQSDIRVALRVAELPGPGEVPATDVDNVQRRVVAPAEGTTCGIPAPSIVASRPSLPFAR